MNEQAEAPRTDVTCMDGRVEREITLDERAGPRDTLVHVARHRPRPDRMKPVRLRKRHEVDDPGWAVR
jgi:hypothetical protein